MAGAVIAHQIRVGDHLLLPQGYNKPWLEVKVVAVDPNLDGHVEVVCDNGAVRVFRRTQTVNVP